MDVRDHAHAHTTRVAALLRVINRDLFFELIDLAHVSSPRGNNFGNKYASRACFSYCYSYVIGWLKRVNEIPANFVRRSVASDDPFF